jgi:hypothetical protein
VIEIAFGPRTRRARQTPKKLCFQPFVLAILAIFQKTQTRAYHLTLVLEAATGD